MALYRDPKTVLLEIIERDNDIVLSPEDYDFSDPVPVTPPAESDAVYNTRIIVTANNVAAPYQGEIDFYYNRLDLGDLAKMVDLSIRSPMMESTHDLIPSLNRRFGLSLSTHDIVLEPTVDMGGYRRATLRAEPTSLGWIGEVDLNVMEGDLNLEDHLVNVALGGLHYPTEYPTKTFASFYSYWRDFSDHFDYLKTLKAGDPITLELVAVMNDVTEDVWVGAGQSDFSLAYSEITYAGPTSENGLANDDYDFVIIIKLDLDACESMTGELIIHFSEPEDPHAYVGGNDE